MATCSPSRDGIAYYERLSGVIRMGRKQLALNEADAGFLEAI
jgi:hypothetical protein